MIAPIEKIPSMIEGTGFHKIQESAPDNRGMFASVFQSAIDNVKQTEQDAVKAEYLMATGQLDNPAELMIAQTKSALAVDMMVQLRNKALEAYQEISRINL